LPRDAGVYFFHNAKGVVLYIGKAKNLRARVRQYFAGTDGRAMVPHLLSSSKSISFVLVQTEKEALLLENTLIKKHRPRYNVRLVDDSSFLHLRIDLNEAWPWYQVVRRIKDDKARYFGPFTSASRARSTLEFVNRRFPLRTCSNKELASRTRPCLLHQMHRCVAPCVQLCTPLEYGEMVEQSILFLEGRDTALLKRLRASMALFADKERFEQAARMRDLIVAIDSSIESQHVVDRALTNRDIWGMHLEGESGAIALLPVRRGRMQESVVFPLTGIVGADHEILSSFLNAWYGRGHEMTGEVVVGRNLPDADALQEVLSERRGRRVRVWFPKRGPRVRLVQIAKENARAAYETRISKEKRRADALRDLQRMCRLTQLPSRIECFDNSNIQGSDPVASMSVLIDGEPDRKAYRRYRVKTVVGADDFASMEEILGRRLRRGLDEDNLPDLVVVDGGKGQLSSAIRVFSDLGIHHQLQSSARRQVGLVALAKPHMDKRTDNDPPGTGDVPTDRVFLPGIKNALQPRSYSRALQLLQFARDESHRVAVEYHRKVRRRGRLTSQLDTVSGIGPARRRMLLREFGSVQGLRMATAEQIASLPGISSAFAQRIVDALQHME